MKLEIRTADPNTMCYSKRRFRTAKDAVVGMLRATAEMNDNKKTAVYECPFCKNFHWGHNNSKPGEVKYVLPTLKVK